MPSQPYVDAALDVSFDDHGERDRVRQEITKGISLLGEELDSVVEWFARFEYFHTRYKHGLSIPLRLVGKSLPRGTIEARRATLGGTLMAYDSSSFLADSLSGEKVFAAASFSQPSPIAAHLAELTKDRNLLRVVMQHNVSIDDLLRVARTTLRLQEILRENRLELIHRGHDGMVRFVLPEAGSISSRRNVLLRTAGDLPVLDDFQVRL